MKKPLLGLSLIVLLLGLSGCALFAPAHQGCEVADPDLRGNYVGQCKDNKAHGRGKAVGKDTYEGEFYEGYTNGQGVYIWSDGDKFIGQFKMGKVHGKGTMIVDGGKQRYSGVWVDNKRVTE